MRARDDRWWRLRPVMMARCGRSRRRRARLRGARAARGGSLRSARRFVARDEASCWRRAARAWRRAVHGEALQSARRVVARDEASCWRRAARARYRAAHGEALRPARRFSARDDASCWPGAARARYRAARAVPRWRWRPGARSQVARHAAAPVHASAVGRLDARRAESAPPACEPPTRDHAQTFALTRTTNAPARDPDAPRYPPAALPADSTSRSPAAPPRPSTKPTSSRTSLELHLPARLPPCLVSRFRPAIIPKQNLQ